MSMLQDPTRALDQIDWYLANRRQEKFPEAYVKAAGNLARQLLEQVLLISAYFSGLPDRQYLRPDGRLRNAGPVAQALTKTDPATGRRYYSRLRTQPARIRKFAFGAKTLAVWINRLNEPSHFRTPHSPRRTFDRHIAAFAGKMRSVFDRHDAHLLVAIANVLRSPTMYRIVFSNDSDCRPGLQRDVVVGPRHVVIESGVLSIQAPESKIEVLPAERDKSWLRDSMAILQHDTGPFLQARLITRTGQPIDLTTFETALASLGRTASARRSLQRHLLKLGIHIRFSKSG